MQRRLGNRRASMRRVLDVVIACGVLILAAPVMIIACIGIWMASPGPIFYRATRIGRDRRRWSPDDRLQRVKERRQPFYRGREFTMYKFRTMRRAKDSTDGPITSHGDPRVYPLGGWLRAIKIDELPQLFNVIRGDMALVGPRPEDPSIVQRAYDREGLATLQVRPGLTSPGTLFYYTHCEHLLNRGEADQAYVERLLPIKLALDRVYIAKASTVYDLRILLRTVWVIGMRTLGRRRFPDPPELATAVLKIGCRPSLRREVTESDCGQV
jgi:lipopolysaccharide/colanic/teichoic acid biosynthesis glycosyltransferase